MSELVSIIVPIYNVEKYLNECIKSLVSQTYPNVEIILVDDGSSDRSSKICDEWGLRDSRIKVIHKTNGGLSDARNAGLEIAEGRYLMFVDSDDFVDSSIVSELYNSIKETDSEIACGGVYSYKDGEVKELFKRKIVDNTVYSGMNRLKALLNTVTDCAVWGKLYKKEVIGNHRFIKDRYNEDVIFLFDIYLNCDKIVYKSRPLYYYRITYGSITNTVGIRTMDCLKNAFEMERKASEMNIPIKKEIESYKLRICIELGYIIQRSNQQKNFPNETKFVKGYILKNFKMLLLNSKFNYRDYIHAIINLIRL